MTFRLGDHQVQGPIPADSAGKPCPDILIPQGGKDQGLYGFLHLADPIG